MTTSMKAGLAGIAIEGKGRVVARNTWRYRTADGIEHVRLHGTDVVEFLPGDKVRLNSGGWKTVTTKDRINSFSPYHVFSNRGTWLVYAPHDSGLEPVAFYDGIILPDAFKAPKAKSERLIAREAKLKARIKAVVAKAIVPGKPLPHPEMGDCFICMMEASQIAQRVQHSGYDYSRAPRPALDSGHIESHIKEGYIHGTLVVNAYRDSGRSEIAFQYDSARLARGESRAVTEPRRIVAAYLKRRMGLTAR